MICLFCKGLRHETIECPIEVKLSKIIKNYVGIYMEHLIANNLKCPECKKNKLCVVGDNTPSKDIVCKSCNQIFEIKSKCLSSQIIPKDIKLEHGLYNKYIEQKNKGLNFIFVIYSINRFNHIMSIREVLYASNFDIDNIVFVNKNINNTHSIITIPNRTKLNKLSININKHINTTDMIEYLKSNMNKKLF
jgi:hypothetical protein